jgi:hypothetical protein
LLPKNPKKSPKAGGNPYKVLYWMGAAVAVLFLGIIALVMLSPKPGPYVAPDPERTLLWLYDQGNPSVAAAAIIEESRSRGAFVAVPFTPNQEMARSFAASKSGSKVREELEGQLQHKLHHRAIMPYSVVSTLVDAFGGIAVEGKSMNGAEAVAYIGDGGSGSAQRATGVMLALSAAVTQRQPNLGLGEALALARQVDTDMDLTALPDVLARWSSYTSPRVQAAPTGEPAAIARLLLPDPVAPAKQP